MLNQLINKYLYAAPYALKYGDLLKFKQLSNIKFINAVDTMFLQLYYRNIDKRLFYSIKKLIKMEPLFYSSNITDDGYCLTFTISKPNMQYVDMIDKIGFDLISNYNVKKLHLLLNKKAPTL